MPISTSKCSRKYLRLRAVERDSGGQRWCEDRQRGNQAWWLRAYPGLGTCGDRGIFGVFAGHPPPAGGCWGTWRSTASVGSSAGTWGNTTASAPMTPSLAARPCPPPVAMEESATKAALHLPQAEISLLSKASSHLCRPCFLPRVANPPKMIRILFCFPGYLTNGLSS